jgi:hypothetical protein
MAALAGAAAGIVLAIIATGFWFTYQAVQIKKEGDTTR